MPGEVLIIGCGAIGRELARLRELNGWSHVTLRCLPPELHNRPEHIVPALRAAIEQGIDGFDHVFVAYGDCGSGGAVDRLLGHYGLERLPGAHCYEFLAGTAAFSALSQVEPGTFYLTDFLVRHFDRLVWRGLGLDRHPRLRDAYFGHYRRVVYLAQSEDPELEEAARGHARALGLDYSRHDCGLGHLDRGLSQRIVQWQS
jgi:hypothetical protein